MQYQVLLAVIFVKQKNKFIFHTKAENKLKIMEKLNNYKNPLVELSKWNNDKHYLKRQIGFNSLFLLDNACMSYLFYRVIETF